MTTTTTTAPACPVCGRALPVRPGRRGRPPAWCGKPCRQTAYRARQAPDRAAAGAAATLARLAVAKTQLNEAEGAMAAAYGRMLAEATEAGDDPGAALGHHDRHRWEMPLADAARQLQRAAAAIGDLAHSHARHADDYRTARATFRRPPAPILEHDENVAEAYAAAAATKTTGDGVVDRDELFDAIEDLIVLHGRGEFTAAQLAAVDAPLATLLDVLDDQSGSDPLDKLVAAAWAVLEVLDGADLPALATAVVGRLAAALPSRT